LANAAATTRDASRTGAPGAAHLGRATRVSLLRWLRRQLRQPEPLRERLEAAIEHGDPAEARRIVARFAFSDAQRRYVDRLIDDWERDAHLSAEDRFLPRLDSP
jgi:hypothetical protein